jgi:hypothetical protein
VGNKNMTNKLPFKITPAIKRYINEMIDFCYDWEKEKLDVPFPIPVEIYTLRKDLREKFTTESETNRGYFILFLEKEGAIEYLDSASNQSLTGERPIDNAEELEGYPEIMVIKILDAKPLRKLQKDYLKIAVWDTAYEGDSENTTTKRLITKSGEGTFIMGKTGEPLPFDKGMDYYYVFLSIYNLTGGDGGQIPYSQIINQVKQLCGKTLTKTQIKNCIHNTLNHLYLPKQEGKKILKSHRGKFVIFFNPPMN